MAKISGSLLVAATVLQPHIKLQGHITLQGREPTKRSKASVPIPNSKRHRKEASIDPIYPPTIHSRCRFVIQCQFFHTEHHSPAPPKSLLGVELPSQTQINKSSMCPPPLGLICNANSALQGFRWTDCCSLERTNRSQAYRSEGCTKKCIRSFRSSRDS